MASIQTNSLRPGMIYSDNGNRYLVLKYNHIKKGRGQAVIRVKVKDIDSKSTTEITYTNEQKVSDIDSEKKNAQYLYQDNEKYYFMNSEDYSQFFLTGEELGDQVDYFKEGISVVVLFVEGESVSIELPKTVELKIIETEPAVAGNTATGATKDAILESGVKIQVPLFLKSDEVIRVNTLSGSYISRV